MLSVTFAFVVATALLLSFATTRALGVVGVFVLLCLQPLVFGGLMLLAFVAYLLLRRRQGPQTRLLPPPGGRGRNVAPALAALGAGGALAACLGLAPDWTMPGAPVPARSSADDGPIVLRTPGGMLEVSEIHATEVIDARFVHSVLGFELGHTAPRIRVPAVYRYRVRLAPELRVVRSDGTFVVVAPSPRPSLPVAVDLGGIEKEVAGTWALLPFVGGRDLERLERGVTARLAERAGSRAYVERQREEARATLREFVRAWLAQQTRWRDARFDDVRVLFADEPAGAIAAIAG